ncbi:MAG: redox-regulated ATPase YchF [Clostridia bacterium]
MKIGLIGLPSVGKTTFFRLLTQAGENLADRPRNQAGLGCARVPDVRIDYLSGIYAPKKTTYATMEVTDIQGILPGSGSYHFLEAVREADALVHVVRVFKDDTIVHYQAGIHPLKDMETVNLELLFADLSVIENRMGRIEAGRKMTKDSARELEVLKKCRECLEAGKPLNSLDLDETENIHIKSFDFLTERPMVLLMNLDEDQFSTGDYNGKRDILEYAAHRGIPLIEVCAKTELEISLLDVQDRTLFMEEMKITESGLDKLATTLYGLLGLISFITVGADEVRAWPVRKGINAKAAGGKIHSDIDRGFIRAEVVKYADYIALGGMQKVKEKGLFRLEGKDAVIEDGDIVNFRFNV